MRPCNCWLDGLFTLFNAALGSSGIHGDMLSRSAVASASLTTTAEMFTNSFLVRLSATHTKIM